MNAVIPKISDVKNLQDLSKVIVLPLISVSYVLQTGLVLSLGDWVFGIPEQASPAGLLFWTILIFTLKAIFISVQAVLLYVGLFYAHVWLSCYRMNLMPCVALIFISLGFYGVLTEDSAAPLSLLDHSWFYSSFVIGFFLLQATSQFEEHGLPPLFSIRENW